MPQPSPRKFPAAAYRNNYKHPQTDDMHTESERPGSTLF